MVQAAHCADSLIAEFIEHARALPRFDDTVFMLVGDHLMHETLLYLDPANDGIFGAILNTGRAPASVEGVTTHMDLAPTLLGLLAVQTNATFLDGNDAFGERRALRSVDFLNLPPAVAQELGAHNYRAAEKPLGVVYKHSVAEVIGIVRERKVPRESAGPIGWYTLSTKSPKFTNDMVLLEAPRCEDLRGTPSVVVSDERGQSQDVAFATSKAGAFIDPASKQCYRLLSFFVAGDRRASRVELALGTTRTDLRF